MKSKKHLLLLAAACSLVSIFCLLTAFKSHTKPCEVTCQFSPVTSDFAACGVSNCNSSQSVSSVLASTNWIPILPGTGCTSLTITTTLPATHPAGTITITDGSGTVVALHTVSADQVARFRDLVHAECESYFHVSW